MRAAAGVCERSERASAAAGLVSSKTSLQAAFVSLAFVSLGANDVADRRVRRLKRSVWASGHLHGLAEKGHRSSVPHMVTLTYRGVADWRADHVSAAVQKFRNWCRRERVACRYTWVAELQRRGAVHYHLVAWLPVGKRMPKWDAAGWWQHGMTNRQECRTGVGYLMKYLSKLGCLTRFPKGLRLYGVGGLDLAGRAIRQWHNLPQWAKAAYGVGALARRAGRLVVRATGELLEPVYAVHRVPGGLALQQLRHVEPRFPGERFPGPFSAVEFP